MPFPELPVEALSRGAVTDEKEEKVGCMPVPALCPGGDKGSQQYKINGGGGDHRGLQQWMIWLPMI